MNKNKRLGKKFALRSCLIFKQEIKFKRSIEDWQLANNLKDEAELITAFEQYVIALCTKILFKKVFVKLLLMIVNLNFAVLFVMPTKKGLKVHDYVEGILIKICDKYGLIYGKVHDYEILDNTNAVFEISFPSLNS